MWEKAISFLPSVKTIICAVLSWAIPMLVYTVNQRLHRAGDPPWRHAEATQGAVQESPQGSSQSASPEASQGATQSSSTSDSGRQQGASRSDAGGEANAAAGEQP